ncbi:MAG: DUF1611 domain-containing protein, partial [Bacilli bacterium]
LYNIKIITEKEQFILGNQLIEVLKYVYNNIPCDIINLSMGICSMDNLGELEEICRKISNKGCILVSSFDNNGSLTYPAEFDSVIGVISSEDCSRIDDLEVITDNTIVNVCAKGNIQRICWNNGGYILSEGNSLACAHVTGIISTFYIKGMSGYDVIKKLSELGREKNIGMSQMVEENSIPKYQKAIVFPFNKEIHSLIRFSHLLDFEIIDVYDIKYLGKVGSTVNCLLNKNPNNDYMIKNIENINWDTFDTIILGHTKKISKLLRNDNFIKAFILQAISNEKMIYSFDDLSYLGVDSEKIFYPKIKKEDIFHAPFGKLHIYSKPIVGVYGTSSQQGKFSLQLKLRERFIKGGYNIGQIGTEPSAWLFNMDVCFHFGYESFPEISRYETVEYLNNKISKLCKDKDIILTGCQSFTISDDIGNLDGYTFPQIEFLLATQPDVIILCINAFDSFEEISRTIKFLEGAVKCRVIGIVLFPMDVKNMEEGYYGQKIPLSKERKEEIQGKVNKKFQLPLYTLDAEEDIDYLYQDIINFFAD